MARVSRKGRAGTARQQGKAAKRPRASPPPESIISVEKLTSPKSGKTYRVIETTEMDAYEKVEPGERPGRAKKKAQRG